MIIKNIKLSHNDKERLIRLKGKTGIQNWNILCRWAFCLSLGDSTPLRIEDIPSDSNVEMSWAVFAGEFGEIYEALLKQRCINDGVGSDPETLAQYFKIHLHRGISRLSAKNYITSLTDLVELTRNEIQ